MCNKIALILLILLSGVSSALAQQGSRPFVLQNTEIIPIHSEFTRRDHELVVIYPSSYTANPDKKYPVLYFLDAYWDAPMLTSIYGNLIYDNAIPEFIMVGFSYPSSTDYGKERRIDYTITPIDKRSGKANLFLDFITKEVAPLIESKYRGQKNDRVLAGSSLGGLFTNGAAYLMPDFFAGYISISPAAEWDGGALAKWDADYAKKHKALNGRMFVSYGTDEYSVFRDPIVSFQKQLAGRRYQGLDLLNYTMEGIDHAGVKAEGYTRGLIWVWKTKKPAGPSGIEKAYTGAQ